MNHSKNHLEKKGISMGSDGLCGGVSLVSEKSLTTDGYSFQGTVKRVGWQVMTLVFENLD